MQKSVELAKITEFLNTELSVAAYSDSAHNGLQVESMVHGISRVGFALDCGLSILEQAVQRQCQLLVVHHGLLWGQSEPIVGPWARKLALCLTQGLSVYAAHLPLDGHLTLGNAAVLARKILGAIDIRSAFDYHGSTIGVTAKLPTPVALGSIVEKLGACDGALAPPLVLPFGKTTISSVGIATGSATFLIPTAARMGIDLFITGEPKQQAYHKAKEFGVSLICMGHYGSETFGVRELQRVLTERFSVQTEWIDEPTGI